MRRVICTVLCLLMLAVFIPSREARAAERTKISAVVGTSNISNILVDGGVNAETAVQCVEAGADTLIMGTALLKAQNPSAVMAACRALEK